MLNEKIIECFKEAVENKKYVGELENPDAFYKGNGCKDPTRDHISLYLKIDCDIIIQVRYVCEVCCPSMFAVSVAFFEMIEGKKVDTAININIDYFSEILGVTPDEVLEEHFNGIKSVFENAIKLYYKKCSDN